MIVETGAGSKRNARHDPNATTPSLRDRARGKKGGCATSATRSWSHGLSCKHGSVARHATNTSWTVKPERVAESQPTLQRRPLHKPTDGQQLMPTTSRCAFPTSLQLRQPNYVGNLPTVARKPMPRCKRGRKLGLRPISKTSAKCQSKALTPSIYRCRCP